MRWQQPSNQVFEIGESKSPCIYSACSHGSSKAASYVFTNQHRTQIGQQVVFVINKTDLSPAHVQERGQCIHERKARQRFDMSGKGRHL